MQITQFKDEADLKKVLASQYLKTVQNFFGDEKLALEFMSNVSASVQRNPKLLECKPDTLLNSFLTMASLKLMPSGISGEAYVIPYKNNGVYEAQFQLGYQGLVTLFYRAGAKSIVAEIVRKNDKFTYANGEVAHEADVFAEDRGEPIGAYVIIDLQSGGRITKVMSKKDILGIGEKFSKTYGKDFSIWDPKNDPELWTWKKTALKQAGKLVPKNETIYRALAEDNKDSVIVDRKEAGGFSELGAPVAHDLDELRASLRNCKTTEELERAWADVPASTRTTLRPVFDEVLAMIKSEGPVVA